MIRTPVRSCRWPRLRFGRHTRPRNQGSADLDGLPVAVAQHLVESHLRTGLTRQRHDDDLVLGRDLVLFTARLDHCEHVDLVSSSTLSGGRLFVQH